MSSVDEKGGGSMSFEPGQFVYKVAPEAPRYIDPRYLPTNLVELLRSEYVLPIGAEITSRCLCRFVAFEEGATIMAWAPGCPDHPQLPEGGRPW